MQSAHNLVSKVGSVAAGWAAPDLLHSYEAERRPVAEINVSYSRRRGAGLFDVIAAAREDDLDRARAGIAAHPAGGGRQGVDLG